MFRNELPRIYELRDLLPNPPPADSYFRDLDRSLAEIPQKLRQFRDLERALQGLDLAAWDFLKSEVLPLLRVRDPKRGWQPLWDKLNQVKAYNHLKGAGYRNIRFIPPSTAKRRQTPDLQAELGSTKALCEVKTINISEIEAARRHNGGVGRISDRLDAGFFAKLAADLKQAETQMLTYDGNLATRRIAYIVVKFDDVLHENADRYREQIDKFVRSSNPSPGIEAVFDIEPAFYAAMS
jgi:hypothetical protein